MSFRFLALLPALVLTIGATAGAATPFHMDTFDAGATGGWAGGASPTIIPNAGQTGDGDGILRLSADSANGPGSRLATFNLGSNWTGNYDGITSIQGDFMNPTSNLGDLSMRFVLFSGATRWTSSVALTLPRDGEWHTLTFPISASDLTRVQGSSTSTYASMISNVNRAMFRHQSGAPSSRGSVVDGILNIDNLVLLAEPMFFADANGDGFADVTDFNAWNANRGKSGTDRSSGDFNEDGVTDQADFELWNSQRFSANPNASQPAAVPEPAEWPLFAAAMSLVALRKASRELA